MLSLKSEKPATEETVNELLSSTRPARIVNDANSPNADAAQRRSRSESDDDYEAVIAVLTDRCRVIECRDRIQWIIQFRETAETTPTARWRSRSFCRTREALVRCAVRFCGTARGLERLPAWCEAPR
jgi:hypothetical protein